MKKFFALFVVFVSVLFTPVLAQESSTDQELPPELVEYLDSLTPRTGKIEISAADASLDLGEEYIFYDANDAKAILTDLWGNPPDSVSHVLGMVMPAGSTPISDSWGAVISFEETGYVSDEDAASTDYDELLELLQEGTEEASQARVEAGYESMELVGWAARPAYDKSTHSVVWAQNLKFGGEVENSLNYDVRTLGRYGVLSVNLVSTMGELENIRIAANDFASHAAFNEGARYQDFNPATDKVAEYGVGGLIAASAGVAAAKKFGIFAILAKFIKPILLGLVVFFGAFWSRIKRLIGFGKEEEYDYSEDQWDGFPEETPESEPIASDAGHPPSEGGPVRPV